VDKIFISANRVVFAHEPFTNVELSTPLGATTSVSAASARAAKKSRILCFPRAEALQARVYLSHFIHIDRPRSIEIEITSGWNDIQNAEIRVRSASAGLRLRTANAKVTSGDVEIADKSSPGVIAIKEMRSNTVSRFEVPYEVENILPELSVKFEVDYLTANGQCQYFSSFVIPIELPLDVNVHDHFKNDRLFSKFNIKTPNAIPLEILDVGLEGSEKFVVEAPVKAKGPVHVFPRQPASFTYEISTKRGEGLRDGRSSRPSENSNLTLSVNYRCLNEDVVARLQKMFADAVEHSPLHRLGRLLVSTFVDRLDHRILPHQLEKCALVGRVDLGVFENVGWGECLESLRPNVRDDTRRWLQKWHEVSCQLHSGDICLSE